MNKLEIILKISEISGVDLHTCEKVMNAFEKTFEQELSGSKNMGNALDKLIKVLDFINRKSQK